MAQLRKTYASLTSESATSSTSLERTSLQLEAAKSKITELEQANERHKQQCSDLDRRLERWETLDKHDGKEIAELRKRELELESTVRRLEDRAQEAEKNELERAKAYEKEKKRAVKLDARIVGMEAG